MFYGFYGCMEVKQMEPTRGSMFNSRKVVIQNPSVRFHVSGWEVLFCEMLSSKQFSGAKLWREPLVLFNCLTESLVDMAMGQNANRTPSEHPNPH